VNCDDDDDVFAVVHVDVFNDWMNAAPFYVTIQGGRTYFAFMHPDEDLYPMWHYEPEDFNRKSLEVPIGAGKTGQEIFHR